MTKFHAVMIDETGCEFGVDLEADTREAALEQLREDYPESRCDQLETPEQSAARENATHEHIRRGGDWDDDGRPIYHYDYDGDVDYEEEED